MSYVSTELVTVKGLEPSNLNTVTNMVGAEGFEPP